MTLTPLEIKKMGQSLVGQGDTCLKRLEYIFFHNLPQKGNINSSIGTGYHAGIAQHYLDRLHGEDLSLDKCVVTAVETFSASLEFDEYTQRPVDIFNWTYQPKTYRAPEIILNPAEATVIVENLVRAYFDNHHYWDLDKYQVIAVEHRLDLDYPGAPEGWRRGGGIDLVISDGTQYILDDQKTTRKKWDKKKGTPTNPQAAWYIDAWRKWANADDVVFMYSIMGINVDPETKLPDPQFERRLAPRTMEQIEATLERGREYAQLIDQGGPFPASPDSFLCSPHYCDFWDICPFGSTLNLN